MLRVRRTSKMRMQTMFLMMIVVMMKKMKTTFMMKMMMQTITRKPMDSH